MTMRRTAIVTCALLLISCSNNDEQPRWADADVFAVPPVLDPVTVIERDGWRFDVGTEPFDTGEPPVRCLQAVVANQRIGCTRVDAADDTFYSSSIVTRVGDERIIWQSATPPDPDRPVDHYVVWSTSSPDGRRIEPITYEDSLNMFWMMQPGEAPWGYQAIAPDGTLIAARSYVGLPAD